MWKLQKNLPCVEGWKHNISSFKSLRQDVRINYNFSYLLTNRLKQDALEKLFSIIRNAGGNSDSPIFPKFNTFLKESMNSQFFEKSFHGNCLEDGNEILNILQNGPKDNFILQNNSSTVNENADVDKLGTGADKKTGLVDYFSSFNPEEDNVLEHYFPHSIPMITLI